MGMFLIISGGRIVGKVAFIRFIVGRRGFFEMFLILELSYLIVESRIIKRGVFFFFGGFTERNSNAFLYEERFFG